MNFMSCSLSSTQKSNVPFVASHPNWRYHLTISSIHTLVDMARWNCSYSRPTKGALHYSIAIRPAPYGLSHHLKNSNMSTPMFSSCSGRSAITLSRYAFSSVDVIVLSFS